MSVREVLADHQLVYKTAAMPAAATVRCECGEWQGPLCDHAGHLEDMLIGAGLLAPEPVVTVEESPEGDPAIEAVQAWFNRGGC